MAVEDRFGISIRDADATGICTVGDLVALEHSRILAATAQPCATMRAFLMCRRLVRDVVHDRDFRVLLRDNVASLWDPGRRRKLCFVVAVPVDEVTFTDYVPGGNLGVFADRWKWIDSSILPAWRKLVGSDAEKLKELMKAFLSAEFKT